MNTGMGTQNLSTLQELVMDREAWHAVVHGVAKKSDKTERLNWTELSLSFLQGIFPTQE